MSKALLLLIGLLLGACATSSNPGAAASPTSPTLGHVAEAASLESKTVALVEEDGMSVRAFCSGVWVSETSILTANHCVDENIGASIGYVVRDDIFAPGDSRERTIISSRAATLYAQDPAHDLALLFTGAAPPHSIAYLTNELPLAQGMFVMTMGQPLGLWWSFSSGEIAAIRRLDTIGEIKDVLFVQATVPISPGNSGCGLFDQYGGLVGITHGSFTRGQGLNLFIHYQYIEALLREYKVR